MAKNHSNKTHIFFQSKKGPPKNMATIPNPGPNPWNKLQLKSWASQAISRILQQTKTNVQRCWKSVINPNFSHLLFAWCIQMQTSALNQQTGLFETMWNGSCGTAPPKTHLQTNRTGLSQDGVFPEMALLYGETLIAPACWNFKHWDHSTK